MRKLKKAEILDFTAQVIRRSETPLSIGAIYDAVGSLAYGRRVTLAQIRKALQTLTSTREVAVSWVQFKAAYLWLPRKA